VTDLEHMCHSATLFTASGSIDEEALRQHFRRMVTAGVSVGLGSPSAGEGQSLTDSEFGRLCEVGVDICKGRVPVYAVAREAHNAHDAILSAQRAAAAAVDTVQIFPLQAGHGHLPTREEQIVYYREILGNVDAGIGLMLHGGAGYITPVDLVAELCGDYSKISYLEMHQVPLTYLQEVRDAVPPKIRIGVGFGLAHAGLALGATVIVSAEANIIPKTCMAFMDSYAGGDTARLGETTRHIFRFATAVRPWSALAARWIKLALNVLQLPGGQGMVRLPLLMPDQDARANLAAAFDKLRVREYENIDPGEWQGSALDRKQRIP
jgi:dihydrodipicolinate synthase/N-acetylneuraminate lyase